METACLRIKFTPILKDVQRNNSKCYLEIVPEVTCIQNLEKIEWKKQSDFIEYTIPMIYKVILRKRLSAQETNDNLEKTYHSCVDLRLASSMSCINLAAGDVSRMISDTVILGNITANIERDKIVIKHNEIQSDIDLNQDSQNETAYADILKPEQLSIDSAIEVGKQIIEKTIEIKAYASTGHLNIPDTNSVNKCAGGSVSNVISNLQFCKDTITESIETAIDRVTEISIDNKRGNKEDCLRKLRISPICSIDTNETSLYKNLHLLSLNSVAFRIVESQKVIKGALRIKDLPPQENYEKLFTKNVIMRAAEYVENPAIKQCNRELPEEKVAKFVKKMETEIMPLKIMLHDLLQKCASMGLTNTKKYSLSSITYNKMPVNSNQLKKYCDRAENRIKCNRVVYSVVFDG